MSMARNVEIKARVSHERLKSIEREARARSKTPVEQLEQNDTFYAVGSGRLKLRRFADGAAELIAYDRPDDQGPTLSSYVRCPCSDPDSLDEALSQTIGVRSRVKKSRRVLIVDQTRVHLDCVAGLGSFVELEVILREDQTLKEGQAIAHHLMHELRIKSDSLVRESYVDLIERVEERE